MIGLDDVRTGLRLLRDLPGFLRAPVSIADTREVLVERLADRESRLLAVAAAAIDRPGNPYGALLRHAGCEPGDLRSLVRREGVNGALATLAELGVWISCAEFKGRVPVRRGSLEFEIRPRDLLRPGAVVHGVSESSGSRGHPTAVPIDLAFIADHAVNTWLGLAAHDGLEWTHARWGAPGGTSVTNPLEFARGGSPPRRWFNPIPLTGLPARYRLADWTLRLGGILGGVRLPGPTEAPLDDPLPLVRWLRRSLDAGEVPHVWTFASSAVLACQAAREAGVDIAGARFTMGGEPTTVVRRAAVEELGAVALPRYGATETDILAFACRAPLAADDMHFFHDRHALVSTPAGSATCLPAGSLLFTSLLRSAPVVLFNTSLGDVGEVDRSPCGCPMEAFGWPLRVRYVRSFEKLTAGGVAFLDVDVARVLEEVLPRRFGGRPTDYQVVEESEPDGRAGIRLRAHPNLGPLDETAVAEAFLGALGVDGGERLMTLALRHGGVVRVERAAPERTSSGKILHVHAAGERSRDTGGRRALEP